MAPLTHDEVHARSYTLLTAARLEASKTSGYDYKTFREEIARVFHERSGFEAHSWQLDTTESVHLGLDTVVIAGTGKGKTTPFFTPLLNNPKKKAIIISPLIILQEDHAARFNKLGVPSVAVNGDTWNRQLRKDLISGQYQGILASPEMCLKHEGFRRILTDGDFADISAIYIDEAHCISQWGGDFRKTYSKLSKLRTFFPPEIPIYVTSATMPPACLREVRASLGIDAASSFTLNLGNDRPNIAYEVHDMKSSDDFIALKPYLSSKDNPLRPEDLRKTIIFTNTVATTQHATREIRSWLPDHLHGQVAYLHAHRSRKDKRRIMRRFRRGDVKILVATEAAGMGADIPDIEQVIQFGVPSSLSVWFQRAGRAGRSEGLEARAILLVEESMFKKQKSRAKKPGKGISSISQSSHVAVIANTDDDNEEDMVIVEDEDGKEYKKKVDPALRAWIEIRSCRRDAADKYFNNPPVRIAPVGVCCDNCSRQELCILDIRPSTPISDNSPSSTHTTPSKSTNANGKRPLVQEPNVPDSAQKKTRRVKEHRKVAKQALEQWRLNRFHELYNPAPFTSGAFLPDKTLDAFAAAKHMRTVGDMRKVAKWVFIDRHGEEVLKVLRRVDDRREAAKQRKAAERKEETAAKKAEKKRVETLERKSKRREAEMQKEAKRVAAEQEKIERTEKKTAIAAAKAATRPPPKRPRRGPQPGISVLNLSTSPAPSTPNILPVPHQTPADIQFIPYLTPTTIRPNIPPQSFPSRLPLPKESPIPTLMCSRVRARPIARLPAPSASPLFSTNTPRLPPPQSPLSKENIIPTPMPLRVRPRPITKASALPRPPASHSPLMNMSPLPSSSPTAFSGFHSKLSSLSSPPLSSFSPPIPSASSSRLPLKTPSAPPDPLFPSSLLPFSISSLLSTRPVSPPRPPCPPTAPSDSPELQ